MKAYLTKRYHFPASHRLHSESLDEKQNVATYGKCNNPHGHGHNYAIEVTVAGPIDRETGMVFDLARLDATVQRQVLDVFDHANLNTLQQFAGRVPTTENLCVEIYNILSGPLNGRLDRVRLEETSNNSFEYAGGNEARR